MLFEEIPDDLQIVKNDIKRQKPNKNFRGVPPKKYMAWIPVIGRKDKMPSLTKTFRFKLEDTELLERICREYRINETTAIRLGLESLSLELTKK